MNMSELKSETIDGKKYYFKKDDYEKVINIFDSKKNYLGSAKTKKDIVLTLKNIISMKIPNDVIAEMYNIKEINASESTPEDLGEWQQAHFYAKTFYKYLKKYPNLRKLGFDELDIVYDE
jgi:hypothetical protein